MLDEDSETRAAAAVTSTVDANLPNFEREVVPGSNARTQHDVSYRVSPEARERCAQFVRAWQKTRNRVAACLVGYGCDDDSCPVVRCRNGSSRHKCLRSVLNKAGNCRVAALPQQDSPTKEHRHNDYGRCCPHLSLPPTMKLRLRQRTRRGQAAVCYWSESLQKTAGGHPALASSQWPSLFWEQAIAFTTFASVRTFLLISAACRVIVSVQCLKVITYLDASIGSLACRNWVDNIYLLDLSQELR